MGLDQYAYAAMRAGQDREFWETCTKDDSGEWVNHRVSKPRELMYWRKHPNLQGYMEQLWTERGQPDAGESGMFNGIELELTFEDIELLEHIIREGQLPDTRGFFFGNNSDEYYRDQDLAFCREARAALFLGERVFYNSSW